MCYRSAVRVHASGDGFGRRGAQSELGYRLVV